MKKMNKEMQEVLDHFEKLKPLPIEELSPENARNQVELKDAVMSVINEHVTKRAFGVIEEVGSVEHLTIPAQGRFLMIRIYTPKADQGSWPACLYFHGGGMVIANLNTYDASCRALCNAAKCKVISVAYRQAPENPFPAAVKDALLAYEWLIDNAVSLNIDTNKIALVGESAGGNLVAGLAQQIKQTFTAKPVHQVLIYPMLSNNLNTQSYQEFEFAKPLNKAMMQWFWDHYIQDAVETESYLACPLKAVDLSKLPATTIILAEIDPLWSEGEEYGQRLTKAGIDTVVKTYKGVAHEFFGMGAVVPEAKEAMSLVAERLGKHFNDDNDEIVTMIESGAYNINVPIR